MFGHFYGLARYLHNSNRDMPLEGDANFKGLKKAYAKGTELKGKTLGVLGFGHNHPRIIGAEKICHELKILDAVKVAPHKLQAALAHNLAQLLPDPLNVSFFAVSGAEAVEVFLFDAVVLQIPSSGTVFGDRACRRDMVCSHGITKL